jgi:hypothetical protein
MNAAGEAYFLLLILRALCASVRTDSSSLTETRRHGGWNPEDGPVAHQRLWRRTCSYFNLLSLRAFVPP